ncbi:hypothetical protein ACC718_38185, partial [Rhizobium ruizarguesonis]
LYACKVGVVNIGRWPVTRSKFKLAIRGVVANRPLLPMSMPYPLAAGSQKGRQSEDSKTGSRYCRRFGSSRRQRTGQKNKRETNPTMTR